MGEEKTKNYQHFKQNSELEVLISAAIVFTAFVIQDVAGEWIIKALNNNISGESPVLFIAAIAGLYMSSMLPISIVSHFILRIYWLSLVGLRSVYPDQKKEKVNPKFDKVVNNSLNLDKRINAVDKICSSIFAFTFLTLFAFCFSFISITVIIYGLAFIDDPWGIASNFSNLFLFLALVYLIDFLSLGGLKRVKAKWFATIYYPVYRFFGWITLAFLYRGIYYSLIQHASKRIMLLITPIYIVLALVFLNLGYDANALFPDITRGKMRGEIASVVLYRDQFPEKFQLRHPFTDSFVIPHSSDYMKVYFSLDHGLEEDLLELCDSVEKYNKRGVHWREWVQTDLNRLKYDSTFNYRQNALNILDCYKSNVSFFIDDTLQVEPRNFYFSRIDRPEHAIIFTTLDVQDLARGDHMLNIKESDTLSGIKYYIPFWRD